MFQAKTPLHEVGRVKFSIGHRRDRDWGKTGCRVRLSRRAGKLTLRKSGTERLIRGHGCVNRTAWHSRRNGCPTNGSKKPALKSLDVGRIDANHIGDGAGQYVTEDPEAGTQHGLRFKLPGNGCSGLQYREGRRGKHVAETGLNGGVQGLIHIMRDGIERAAQTGDMLMRIQWVGIQRISYPEGPGQLLGHLPSVLCVEIEIEKVERLVR